MRFIKSSKNWIHKYTNELKDLEYKQNITQRKYLKALIEEKNKYREAQKYLLDLKNPENVNSYKNLKQQTLDNMYNAKHDIRESEDELLKLPILVPNNGYEEDNGILGAKRDINIRLMSKLKNERAVREFAGISGEYYVWKNHFLFRILRNAGPKFITHPISDGFNLSTDKYLIKTEGSIVSVFDQLMDRDTGTYQISFKNIECTKLTNIEVGVLPITKTVEGDFHKKYVINFEGNPLLLKQYFELPNLSKEEKQTYQYKEYKNFTSRYGTFKVPINSTLTIRLNTRTGIMIFFVNSTPMEYICDVDTSDFPCKLFIKTEGKDTTVRITRFKHIDTYLNDIDYDISNTPQFKTIAPTYKRRYRYNEFRFDDDDEEPEYQYEPTINNPRRVMDDTTLL
jgi:hypothetical protein